jgi:hypothetical protein
VNLGGRRGIIQEINGNRITIAPTDAYATPDERVIIKAIPATTFVLITIPKTPRAGEEVTRTPHAFTGLSLNDDIFALSFQNVSASTSFSALRIEKIINP